MIAEIGVNHEGSVEAAAELIRSSASSGADAAKLQSCTPERFVAASDAERLARARRFMLDDDAYRKLAGVAREAGIVFCSSVISEDWVDLIAELSPAIEIASGDLTFRPAISAAARSGRTVILSTGCGARVVEVHVTDRKRGRSFRDHELSFDPGELAELAETLPKIAASLGTTGKAPMDCEIGARDAMRKGVVAARALTEGTVLGADDFMFSRRPASPPNGLTMIGRRIRQAVAQGVPLTPERLEQ